MIIVVTIFLIVLVYFLIHHDWHWERVSNEKQASYLIRLQIVLV